MKKWLLLSAVVMIGLVAAPAVADHINEPTAPIVALDLTVLDYASDTLADCSGQTPFAFDKARLDTRIRVSAAPSEHFTVKFESQHRTVTPKGQTVWVKTGFWPQWSHQNVEPHADTITKWPVVITSNTYDLRPGMNEITVTVTGQESGTVLTDTCRFLVA